MITYDPNKFYKWCSDYMYCVGFYRPGGSSLTTYSSWLFRELEGIEFVGFVKYLVNSSVYLDSLEDVALIKCCLGEHIKYIIDQKMKKFYTVQKLLSQKPY